MKKLLALLLALVMVLSMAACAPADQGGDNGETNPPEPVTITMYPLNANLTSGTVGGWLGEFLLSKGIILEIWPYSDEKFTAMVTGGQLPDILYVPYSADFEALSESGLLMDLEPHIEKMPHIANNEAMSVAMDFVKDFVSGGVVNMLPLNIGKAATAIDTERAAVKLHWETYTTIGAPAINTWDDLIDVLKQMKEVYPKSEQGEETYGARLFANDGSYFYSIYNWYINNGCTVEELPHFVEVNHAKESFDYILSDDSQYKAGLKFFNKMFREGLLDPESMNKDRATQQASVTAGGSLAGWPSAPGWEQYGYYPVYIGDNTIVRDESGNTYGTYGYLAVSAQTEELDACLKLLDMFANPDDILTIQSGPQGHLWDVDEEGKGYITDKGYRYYIHGDTVKINGEEFKLFNTQFLVNVGELTSNGLPRAAGDAWELIEYQADTDLMDSWKEVYPGYSGFRELMLDKEQFINVAYDKDVANFVDAADDAQKLIMNAARKIIVQASWKMIYAESDAEFETLWDNAVAECEKAGIKAIYEWRVEQLNAGMEIRDSLKTK